MQGYYHSIETFGTVDGPGIRYVLFLSGCNLGCAFCHNPDTWPQGEKTITVDEVLADLERYRSYYQSSGGGLTVSGGEPLLQPGFVAALFKAAQAAGLHTLLDTSGHCPPENLAAVLTHTDMVQFGLKAASPRLHHRLTGTDHRLILANLHYTSLQSSRLVVRYVLIPGLTDTPEELGLLAGIITALPNQPTVELLPYHTMGCEKWEQLNRPYALTGIPSATDQETERATGYLQSRGLTVL